MFETLKDEEIIRQLKRAELQEELLGKDNSARKIEDSAEQIFAVLVERHHSAFSRLIGLRYGLDAATCDEIVQDFWLECYTALIRYNPDRPFLSWATTILFRTAEKFLHKRRKEIQLSPQNNFFEQQHAHNEDIEDTVFEKEQIDSMLSAIRKLPKELTLLIELRFFQNKKIEEIVEETGLARSTVFQKLNLAYQKIRTQMEKNNP